MRGQIMENSTIVIDTTAPGYNKRYHLMIDHLTKTNATIYSQQKIGDEIIIEYQQIKAVPKSYRRMFSNGL